MSIPQYRHNLDITPTLVISIGYHAKDILRRLEQRRKAFLAFQGLDMDWFSTLVNHYSIADVPDERNEDQSILAIRETFFEPGHLTDVTNEIRNRFRDISGHTYQPLVGWIQPRIIVVGFTWEMTFTALFWPLAHIIRKTLGAERGFELVGIAISANYVDDPDLQAKGDALTFVHLQEGTALLEDNSKPDWLSQLKVYNQKLDTNRPFEQLYFLDSVKVNNTTVINSRNNPTEVMTNVTALIEALTYTDLQQVVDESMMDEYVIKDSENKNRQIYTSVGTSSLRLPLKEISQSIKDYTVGVLLNDRLLVDLSPKLITEANERADNLLQESVLKQASDDTDLIKSNLRSLAETGEKREELSGRLKWRLILNANEPTVPEVKTVQFSAPNPFSIHQSLSFNAVEERLQAEINSRKIVTRICMDTLDTTNAEEIIDRLDTRAVELLHHGDNSLLQAVQLLKRASERAEKRADQYEKQCAELEDSHLINLRSKVEGLDRFYYDERRLKPILDSKPRIFALIARVLLLVVVLFEFFWSLIDAGIQPWPMTIFEETLLSEALGPSWDFILFGYLGLAGIGLIMFFAGLPEIALRPIMFFHRQSLRKLLKYELNSMFLTQYAERMRSGAKQMRSQATALEEIWQGLIDFVAKSFEEIKQPLMKEESYQEYIPVDPSQIADSKVRERMAELTLEQNKLTRIVDDWLPSDDSTIKQVKTASQVIESVSGVITPVVQEILVKPIEQYIDPDDFPLWLQRLWHSSVPWIKIANADGTDANPVTLNLLTLYNAEASQLGNSAHQELDYSRALPWFDPYRVLMLRLVCGVKEHQMSRIKVLENAFQFRTPSEQAALYTDESIFGKFPALLEEPVPDQDDGTTEASNTSVADDGVIDPGEGDTERSVKNNTDADSDVELQHLDESRDTWQAILESRVDAIIQAAKQGDGIGYDMDGVQGSLSDLHSFVQHNDAINATELVRSLTQLDYSRASNEWDKPESVLAQTLADLDNVLISFGLIPYIPEVGERYDPNLHGTATDKQTHNTIPEDHITEVIKRGYKNENDVLIEEPIVYLSVGPDNTED